MGYQFLGRVRGNDYKSVDPIAMIEPTGTRMMHLIPRQHPVHASYNLTPDSTTFHRYLAVISLSYIGIWRSSFRAGRLKVSGFIFVHDKMRRIVHQRYASCLNSLYNGGKNHHLSNGGLIPRIAHCFNHHY
jgi:hypothetical protein